MYDRATRSLWHQFTGKPIIGELVGSGIELEYFPTARTTWGEWRKEYPDTTVLTREGARRYAAWSYTHEDDEKSVYWDYRANPDTMFPITFRDESLEPKDEVLGVSVGDQHRAYPLDLLREHRIVHDQIGDSDVVVIASGVSSDAHIFENPDGLRFSLSDEIPSEGYPERVTDQNGEVWDVSREQLSRIDEPSQVLNAVPSNVSFWFGWYAFHRDTTLYGE